MLAPPAVRGYRLRLAPEHAGAAILRDDRGAVLELLAEAVGGEVTEGAS